jgi:uncharacterized protein YcfJ
MRRSVLLAAACLSLAAAMPARADDGGAAAGAVTGAVVGGVVGGPVGAAVGGGIGGVAGGAASGPNRPDTVVVQPGARPCETTTVRRENAYGESKTVTRESC